MGAGTAVFFIWWWWNRKQKHRPPNKWRKVGELSDLMIFPVKSLGVIRETSMECTLLGLRSGWSRDRTLMVIDLDGQFVTARQLPTMVQVKLLIIFFKYSQKMIWFNQREFCWFNHRIWLLYGH